MSKGTLKILTDNQKYLLDLLSRIDECNGNTKLVKLVFIDQAISSTEHYKFIRWHYGPYSSEIMTDLEIMIDLGLVGFNRDWLGNRVYFAKEKSSEVGSSSIKEIADKINGSELKKFLEVLYENFGISEMKPGESISTTSAAAKKAADATVLELK